ncbi:MAG: PEP-CTERM sorting domain-containing protein [Acidobacteriota bacterium]
MMKFALPSFCRKTLVAAVVLAGASAGAQAYSFDCITGSVSASSDSAGCTSIGASLASWSLVGNLLTISNASGSDNHSFISGISFDTSAGMTVTLGASQMPGVLYTTGGGAHMPSSLGWTIDANFQPDKKPASNGINAGESIQFLLSGVAPSNIGDGSFKFGVHMQGLPFDRSEKLMGAVPEASSYALALAGLLIVGSLARRKA